MLEAKSASLYEAKERLSEETAKVQRLSTAIDVSADGVAIADADGIFTYMNPMHAGMFGYASVDDCLGRPWTSLYDDEILSVFEREVMPAFTRDGYWRGEATGRAQDGSAVHQSLSLTALSDGGILCVSRDIAIDKRRESQREQLQAMLADAERRDALGRMASSVAHDFANILTAINASARLLRNSNTSLKDALIFDRIVTSCSQANDLVDDLMTFDANPVREARAIDEIVRDVVEMMSNQFTAPHRLELVADDERLVCEIDPTLFARLVANLVKNAHEALGTSGTVTVRTMRIQEAEPLDLPFQPSAINHRGELRHYPAARLVVQDDGNGMPQEALDQAFTPFQSSKGRGRGLGLATVDALLTGQEGCVASYSRPAEGTVFVVDLPLQIAEIAVPAAADDSEGEANHATGALVVDDDKTLMNFVCEAASCAGWDPVGFTDPVEALKVFRAAPKAFGVVVTDRRMPQMSGDELVRALLAIRPDTRIVMCSGALQPPLPAGLAATLAKPATLDDLIETIGAPLAD
ncbi:ATP-binding protein [Maricaulis sp.]|uniref:ATP-binding protein n=1 Tax=Maricaulis sp. TaxID=1486257 RepID=UPI003A92691F